MATLSFARLNASEAAGFLLEAWQQRDSQRLDSGIKIAMRGQEEPNLSAFEMERRELLQGIAEEMRTSASQQPAQNRLTDEMAVCLNLLKHLSTTH